MKEPWTERQQVEVPRTWTKFPRRELARAMVLWSYHVVLPMAFIPLLQRERVPQVDAIDAGFLPGDDGISKEMKATMRRTAQAMDAGRDVATRLIEDPRETVSDSTGMCPGACPACDEYPSVLPEWCRLPHSDGKSINPGRRRIGPGVKVGSRRK